MELQYVVITSVTRDDLPDGGADVFTRCIKELRRASPGCKIEVLIPDFQGSRPALEKVIAAHPDVINHNMEVVKPLFPQLRPQGNYDVSLELLKKVAASSVISKSGFMVGFGEGQDDILHLIDDLASVSCARLTIGQYQRRRCNTGRLPNIIIPMNLLSLKKQLIKKGFNMSRPARWCAVPIMQLGRVIKYLYPTKGGGTYGGNNIFRHELNLFFRNNGSGSRAKFRNRHN